MATRIIVPDAGQTTDELLLAQWRVDVGDQVEVGDFLADIETDKAVAELESHVAGHVLKLMAEEGDTIRTGETLLWIGEAGEEIVEEPAAEEDADEAGALEAAKPVEPEPREGIHAGTLATPAARTLARERGVNLADLVGTGPEGCIVKRDVLGVTDHPGGEAPPGTTVPLSDMRRAMAARLQQSVREAPHFYVQVDVQMSRALAARQQSDTKVTVNDIIVKATADTLVQFPRLNCRLEGDTIHYLQETNVGIAVSVEDGLVVPVLARADTLTLADVAQQSRRLIDSAHAGRLPAGLQAGLTVSNLGMYGIKSFSAIINPPEAAILAVGAIEDKLVLSHAGIIAVPTLVLTLSSDHRIIDGDLAARFLKSLKDRLEALEVPNA